MIKKDIFKLMKEKGIALCPTLAAGDAIEQYRGWRKGIDPEPDRITNNKTKNESLCIQIQIVIRNESSFNISHQFVTALKK